MDAGQGRIRVTAESDPARELNVDVADTPAAFNGSTSRTWRIEILSPGIVAPAAKAKGAGPKRASRSAIALTGHAQQKLAVQLRRERSISCSCPITGPVDKDLP